MGLEGDIDYKEYLSIVYGDDVKVIFDRYIFIPSDKKEESKDKFDNTRGKLLYTNGVKVITEDIEDVVPMISLDDIIGYVILLQGDLKILFGVTVGSIMKKRVAVINQDGTFKIGNITCQFYNKIHPEIVVEYNKIRYISKFDGSKLLRFSRFGR